MSIKTWWLAEQKKHKDAEHHKWMLANHLPTRLRALHHESLCGPCEKCGKTDEERYMQEGGWDGSQIAVCECGNRWILDEGVESYITAIGPVTSSRGVISKLQELIEKYTGLT
jgi:hypothetical protein